MFLARHAPIVETKLSANASSVDRVEVDRDVAPVRYLSLPTQPRIHYNLVVRTAA
jgi:hypothetical protein